MNRYEALGRGIVDDIRARAVALQNDLARDQERISRLKAELDVTIVDTRWTSAGCKEVTNHETGEVIGHYVSGEDHRRRNDDHLKWDAKWMHIDTFEIVLEERYPMGSTAPLDETVETPYAPIWGDVDNHEATHLLKETLEWLETYSGDDA